jgi:hypothetical protein
MKNLSRKFFMTSKSFGEFPFKHDDRTNSNSCRIFTYKTDKPYVSKNLPANLPTET